MVENIDQLSTKDFIVIKGARANNLKNISVAIPRNRLVVITGVSGSGKSSLAFDTLFAEGQRMYVESLSAYARQFLGRMEKPDVDYIKGISPAIAIEQKVSTKNPRSTVGTTTEIYDYLKLLFARIGKTYSPVSGREVKKDTVSDVVDAICQLSAGTRVMILCPIKLHEGRTLQEEFKLLLQKGYSRVLIDNALVKLEEAIEHHSQESAANTALLIDRLVVENIDDDVRYSLSDSVQTAFFEGEGTCWLHIVYSDGTLEKRFFSDRFESDGLTFEEPTVNFLSFNSPHGACKRCDGFGNVLGIDADLVIPNKNLSVYEGAIAPWRTENMEKMFLSPLLKNASKFDFPIHRPYKDLDEKQKELLWKGNDYFQGLNSFFEYLESQAHKIQYRVMLSKYRGKMTCPDCRGTRLRKEASYVKINGKSIIDLLLMPISELSQFFNTIVLSDYEEKVAQRLLIEIRNRIGYVEKVGLGYLTLNRLTSTLSGGEFQRIKLATSLGSALVGSMYILDEPSIGLHPRDTENLISVLKQLRNLGNTVIVVEHEEEVMKTADHIIDIGPDAGIHGGEIVFQGNVTDWQEPTAEQHEKFVHRSHTYRFLRKIDQIPLPSYRRKWADYILVKGARENNLKNLDVKFPLGVFTVVTGVSGSGKSTLVKKILYPALGKILENVQDEVGKYDSLEGSLRMIQHVRFIDQSSIGRSSRSNPVTYIGAYDLIRNLYASLPLSKQRNYHQGFFSFNTKGGRCEACEGEGKIVIEMQFMADVHLICEACRGKRFKEEILEVKYQDKNIADVLEMTIEEALTFFKEQPKIIEAIEPLALVGLGYIRLGQSANTLSGGEAQRIKLASFLKKGNVQHNHIFFIFDEPTTGLHFHDIHKLLFALNALVEKGHTVVVIEHNLEMIKSADWIIDLGPEGGERGGYLCFEGTPEEMIQLENNTTARYLREKMTKN